MNWNWDKIFSHVSGVAKKKEKLLDSWTGEWFDAFLIATTLYFVIDLIWIAIIPRCVKSPSTIMQHHIFTMLYILIPYFQHDKRWAMGACMSSEVSPYVCKAPLLFFFLMPFVDQHLVFDREKSIQQRGISAMDNRFERLLHQNQIDIDFLLHNVDWHTVHSISNDSSSFVRFVDGRIQEGGIIS